MRFQLANYQAQVQDMDTTIRTVAAERDQLNENLKTFNIDSTSIQALSNDKLVENKEQVDAVSNIYTAEVTRRYTTALTSNQQPQQKYWALASCAVCRDDHAPPNTNLGCGHVLCNSCAKRVTECPFCRAPVTALTLLYNVFHT